MTLADTTYHTKRDEYHERGAATYRVIIARRGKDFRVSVTAPGVSVLIGELEGPQERVEAFGLDLVNMIEDNRG